MHAGFAERVMRTEALQLSNPVQNASPSISSSLT
jgi:hypothetical protein